MTDAPLVLVRRDRDVVTVSINNPARLNCLSTPVMHAFIDAVAGLQHDPDLADLDPAKVRTFITLVHRMSQTLRDLPVPTIARVNGFCLGAGLEVMAACDLHIASDNAVFGMPEVKIGLPSVVEAALLPQLIGWGRAKLLLYTAMSIDARRALDWGLVEQVVPQSDLDRALVEWLDAIVESGPRAIRLQKELIREWEAMPVNDAIQAGVRSIVRAYETDEPRRRVAEAIMRLQARKP